MRPQPTTTEARHPKALAFNDPSRKGFPAETIVKVYHEQYEEALKVSAAAFLSRMGG